MSSIETPFLNRDAVEALHRFLSRTQRIVLEYGSGASTIWLGRRCSHLISIEYDPRWYQKIRTRLDELKLDNVTLLFAPMDKELAEDEFRGGGRFSKYTFRNFVEAGKTALVRLSKPVDLVLVDGRARNACVRIIEPLVRGGVIALDDAERPRYRTAHKILKARGWHLIRTCRNPPQKKRTEFWKR